MTFKELKVKNSYINHGDENVMDALICPALKLSKSYKRSVGFFSSSVFKLIINSLPNFIQNGGKINLIVSPNLSDEDILTISLGYEKKDFIHKKFTNDFDEELLKFDDESLEILYELISNDYLDIKVASTKNDIGMYHDKLGILQDVNNNVIVFYGSANSSFNAYRNNYEKVRTLKSWNDSDKEKIQDEIDEFDLMWENKNPFLEVYNFKDSIKNSIIKEVDRRKYKKEKESIVIKLYDYQEEAIKNWVNNSYKGFYIMATGTGKTWTAIYSAKRLVDDKKNNPLIVITAPYIHLLKQWQNDVEKVFPNSDIHLISHENHGWQKKVVQSLVSMKYDQNKSVILISTMKSFIESEELFSIINKCKNEKLLIVDEAHRFTRRKDEYKDIYQYMLGLSATPINGKNNSAGIELVNYFGGAVINLPIEVALEKGFLIKYNYHPIFVNATVDEEVKFRNITVQMNSCFKNGVLIDSKKLLDLNRNRLRVISMAEEKKLKIDYLLSKVKDKDHFIVYCGDGKLFDANNDEMKHINFVKGRLEKLGLKSSQFTANENMEKRMQLIDIFNSGHIDSLVAIRCLDEGINIPSIKSALILSSNDDYKEFVQRRGRILRKYPGKEIANIYDVIVLPTFSEEKFAKIELRRFYEYAKLAENSFDLLIKLNELLENYNLKIEDIEFNLEVESDTMEEELDD